MFTNQTIKCFRVYLEPKAKASLKAPEIQYPVEGFESLSAKCN